ncbi:hypothetical protein ACHWQZ_G017803 [Mnemiopsis leidyi]
MAKSKASKEPPKAKEEEIITENEDPAPVEKEAVEEVPSAVTPPIILEAPIEAHLAQIVIDSFGDEEQNPLFTGERTVTYHGGHTYTGQFEDGKMHGEGTYTWSHGLKYQGDFRNNVISGRGSFLWPDGSMYKGDVEDGFRHGKGSFYCANNPSIYSGDWVHGKRTGSGKISYDKDELSYYIGDWVDNKKCGRGFRQYPTGSTFEGEWFENLRHGEGTMRWAGTGEAYTGQWKMGIQHGEGTQTWTVDTSSQLPLKNQYQGQWVDGKREGFGVFSYASGARYEGEWKDNAKHGYGKFFFKDGTVFAGNFENDSIMGRPGSPDVGKLMRSAIVTGRVSSPLQNATKKNQSSFQLNIKSLISDEIFHDEELQQVHNVLLRHISLLRTVYNHYCKLADQESGILARMEFWKFIKDTKMYLKLSMPTADSIISDSLELECETERESPFTKFLFREFLQAVVFLAVHIYTGHIARENGSFVSKCLSGLLRDHVLPLDLDSNTGYSHSHPTNKQYIERCWKIYLTLSKRPSHPFTLRDTLFVLKDLKLLGGSYPFLDVNSVVNNIMLTTNENMSEDEALYLNVPINFYDFFNILCGCALVIKHSSPNAFNLHSQLGTETDISNGGQILLSPEKTPLPPGSESPTKSLSKKNTPSETPVQTPAPSAPDTDNNDGEGSTPIADSVASIDNIREQSILISPSIDERCGSFEDWDSRVEDFFLCHFFPAASKLIEVEAKITEQKEADRLQKEKDAEEKALAPELPLIQLKSPSLATNQSDVINQESVDSNVTEQSAPITVSG